MFKNVLKKELVIPAKMSYLKTVRDFIEEIGRHHHFSERIINSYKLVIDEACTNIIRHGYRDIPDGKITIRAIVRRYSLTIILIDQGITFDPRQAKNPDLKKYIDIGKRGGLGILMMRKLMDDIQYSLTPEGNELRLTKKREVLTGNKLLIFWDQLSMQSRFTVVASAVIIFLGLASLFFFSINSRMEIRDQILNEAVVRSQEYGNLSLDALVQNKYLDAFLIAKNYRENAGDMINDAFLVDVDSFVVVNSRSENTVEKIGKYSLPGNAEFIDSIGVSSIYYFTIFDSVGIFDVSYPIMSESVDSQKNPLAEAHLWIYESYIDVLQLRGMFKVIILVVLILSAVAILTYVLIHRIISPFTQLANWVREVGRGNVDQDEFDIDTSDELGEIAQAFKEMTTKFREAQVGLIEQQRLQKELQVAQEIQHMLLPQDFPQVKGYELASYYEAAKEVGGDLFDFVEVDEDTIGIIVADVSGKGVPGSMIMTMIRTALRLEAKGNKNAADVLARVNRFVTADMRRGMFVTIFYIILDSRNRVVSFASAGHNPMILFRASTQQTYYLNPQGFPVGISLPDIRLFDQTIENDRISLRSDDILIIYTDGVTEAMNNKRELFGDERFLEVIRANGHLPVQDFIRSCRDAIRNFTSGYQQNDDITMVAVKEKMSAEEVRIDIQKKLFHLIDEEKMPVEEACAKVKVSPFTYYKYRPIVDKYGFDGLVKRLHKKDDIELRHVSIEVKTKIFDIIAREPEATNERISELLNTEQYGFVKVSPQVVGEEMHRLKLHTPEKRKKFLERGKKRKFLKIPGSPLLTLDGQVIKDFDGTGVFAPIHAPKKRIFSNIDDLGKDDEAVIISGESEEPVIEPKEVDSPGETAERDVPRQRTVESKTLEPQKSEAAIPETEKSELEDISPEKTEPAITVKKIPETEKLETEISAERPAADDSEKAALSETETAATDEKIVPELEKTDSSEYSEEKKMETAEVFALPGEKQAKTPNIEEPEKEFIAEEALKEDIAPAEEPETPKIKTVGTGEFKAEEEIIEEPQKGKTAEDMAASGIVSDDEEIIEEAEIVSEELITPFDDTLTDRDEKNEIVPVNEFSYRTKNLTKIKTFSEFDREAKSVYWNFYEQENVLIDALDLLIKEKKIDEDHLGKITQILSFLTAKYGNTVELQKLIQIFSQMEEIIQLYLENEDKENQTVLYIIKECLEFVRKRNILAEDIVKISILNQFGLKKRKLIKEYGKETKFSLRRKKNDASFV